MASRFSIDAIYRLVDQFSGPSKKVKSSSRSLTQGIKTDFAKAQRQVNQFGENLKRNAWMGVTAAVAGIGYMMKEGIDLASNLFEVQNVVDTTFGNSKEIINDFAKSAIQDFGISELNAKKFTGTLGAMMKSSGLNEKQITDMSVSLTGLTGDFASFYNLEHEEAFNKIRSGISGETEPLKQLGINMSVASLEAFALSQGIKKQFKNMKESEKTLLRYNYLMSVSKDAQGDFAKTLDSSLANQQRVLQTKFTQKLASAMQPVIPVLIKLSSEFSKFLDSFDAGFLGEIAVGVINFFKTFLGIIIDVIKFLKPFAPFIFGIVAAFTAYNAVLIASAVIQKGIVAVMGVAKAAQFIYIAATQGMTVAQAAFNGVAMANPIGLIIVAIGILIGLIVLLVQNWDKITKAIKDFWDMIVKFFVDLTTWIWKTEEGFTKFGAVLTLLTGPFGLIVSMLMEVGRQWDSISEKFSSGDILGGILAIGGALLSGLLAPIQGFLELVSQIPLVGDLAKGGAAKIAEIRAGLTGQPIPTEKESPIQSPISPTERAATINNNNNTTGEIIINDNSGKARIGRQIGGPYEMKMKRSEAF